MGLSTQWALSISCKSLFVSLRFLCMQWRRLYNYDPFLSWDVPYSRVFWGDNFFLYMEPSRCFSQEKPARNFVNAAFRVFMVIRIRSKLWSYSSVQWKCSYAPRKILCSLLIRTNFLEHYFFQMFASVSPMLMTDDMIDLTPEELYDLVGSNDHVTSINQSLLWIEVLMITWLQLANQIIKIEVLMITWFQLANQIVNWSPMITWLKQANQIVY